MATPPPVILDKSLFEHPVGLLGIPSQESTVQVARNLHWNNVDHLQEATVELVARMSIGWRVRTTPSTNYHCGLYAVYQGFVALSRRFPQLIPGPIPTLNATYNWLVRDRRLYHRFATEHGDYSDVGDIAARAFVHNFSGEQLDLLALWLGQKSNCPRKIRVVSLFQDNSSPSTAHRHYMIHERISVQIDCAQATGELYLFVHYAPDTSNSMAHWSMFSDTEWEFQNDEDPAILNAEEPKTAEDNWALEKQDRDSRPPAKKYATNLPSIEKLAWLCGHLSRNPTTDYESALQPRTYATPHQLSGQFGLGLKDSNLRKSLQTWREKLPANNPKAAACLNTDTMFTQSSIIHGKLKPRTAEYQRRLIESGRFNETTNAAALRRFIDSCIAAPARARVTTTTRPARATKGPKQTAELQSAGADPGSPNSPGVPSNESNSASAQHQPSTPPRAPATAAGPYYGQGRNTSPISPGKAYPAPKDRRGKRIRTPSDDEDEDSSSDDGTGAKKKKKKRRTSASPRGGNQQRSPPGGGDGSGAAPGFATPQASAGGTVGAQKSTATGSAGASARAPGTDPYANVDPMLLRSGLEVRNTVSPRRSESAVAETKAEEAHTEAFSESLSVQTSDKSIGAETSTQDNPEEVDRDDVTTAIAPSGGIESAVTGTVFEEASPAEYTAEDNHIRTSIENVPAETTVPSIIAETTRQNMATQRSRVGGRRRSWPQYGRPLAQLLLRRERERSAQRSISPAVFRPSTGVSRVERLRAGFIRRRHSGDWLRRVRDTSLETAIIAGFSVGSYNLTRMMMSVEWRDMFTAAAEQVGSLNIWEKFKD